MYESNSVFEWGLGVNLLQSPIAQIRPYDKGLVVPRELICRYSLVVVIFLSIANQIVTGDNILGCLPAAIGEYLVVGSTPSLELTGFDFYQRLACVSLPGVRYFLVLDPLSGFIKRGNQR